MKKLTTPVLIYFATLLFSCSKKADNLVYLQLENKSSDLITNIRIVEYISTDMQLKQANITVPDLKPGDISGFYGFKDLYRIGKSPLVKIQVTINGQQSQNYGVIRCGDGVSLFKPGYYTALAYSSSGDISVLVLQ